MRVLHLMHSMAPHTGGTGEAVRQLATASREIGHHHEVLALDPASAPWMRGQPFAMHPMGPVGHYGYTRQLEPWLHRHGRDYDAWVVHGLWQYPGWAAHRAAREMTQPYFVAPHGMLDPWFREHARLRHLKKWLYWRAVQHRVLRDARGVLFTADEEARRARGTFRPYAVQACVVGLGVGGDTAACDVDPDAFLSAYPALRGRRLLLFLGRLHRKKGCDLLLEAFAALADPAFTLVMAGPDDDGQLQMLSELARARGLGPQQLVWTGMLEGALKWQALRTAEALVLPSHHENFGIVVAEALSVGTPVLLSERVNIWREVVDAGAGWAAADTAEGTLSLLRRWAALDGAARAAMRHRARDCFERHFEGRAAARRWAETLSRCLARPCVPAPAAPAAKAAAARP